MSQEVLFGSVPQVWPAFAVPSFAYTQPAAVHGGRQMSPLAQALTMQTPPGNGIAGPIVSPNPLRMDGGSATGAEIAGGITAPALLAVVAVRRGQPLGPTSDQEIEDFIGDALDLLPGSSDIEVRCESGRVTLTGPVSHKRLKRDAGEIAWAIPNVHDVQNNVMLVARRRSRSAGRETETPAVAGRKQA